MKNTALHFYDMGYKTRSAFLYMIKQFWLSSLDNNRESDTFIDSFQSCFKNMDEKMFQSEIDLHKTLSSYSRNLSIRDLCRYFGPHDQNIDKKTDQYASIIKNLDGIFQADLLRAQEYSLLSSIQLHCIGNKSLNVVSDIRIPDTMKLNIEEMMSIRIGFVEQQISGVSKENLEFLAERNQELNQELMKKNIGYMPDDIAIQALSSHLDFLELNIIKHLKNENEKSLIAIIGVVHVNKLYPLLISEPFEYVIDKEVKFEVIKGKTAEELLNPAIQGSCKELLKNKIIEEAESYAVIKFKTPANLLQVLEEVSQIFIDSFQDLQSAELEELIK